MFTQHRRSGGARRGPAEHLGDDVADTASKFALARPQRGGQLRAVRGGRPQLHGGAEQRTLKLFHMRSTASSIPIGTAPGSAR